MSHEESGTTDYTVDPAEDDGVQWLSKTPFYIYDMAWGAATGFTVAYTVDYIVPATGATGSVHTTIQCNVNMQHAEVGTPTWSVTGTFAHQTRDGKPASGCYVTMNIPITGNTPVTFTGWSAKWSPMDHSEGSSTEYAVDPRQYDGLQWLKDTPFYIYDEAWAGATSFDVAYSIGYRVDATGATGSVSTSIHCAPF
jgi:hypothetical protein